MEKYDYDFGFLRRWMQEHKKIQKDLLGYVEIQNYTMTRRWIDGEVMMGTENILKFCNSTGVSPASFFTRDGEPMVTARTDDAPTDPVPEPQVPIEAVAAFRDAYELAGKTIRDAYEVAIKEIRAANEKTVAALRETIKTQQETIEALQHQRANVATAALSPFEG